MSQQREDDCDSWHRNRYTLYSAIADAHRRGVPGLEPVLGTIVERITERIDVDGTLGPPLDTAFALLALGTCGGPSTVRGQLAGSLRDRQRDDGSWERSIFYYGGPREVFGWASETLSTAAAVQALAREATG